MRPSAINSLLAVGAAARAGAAARLIPSHPTSASGLATGAEQQIREPTEAKSSSECTLRTACSPR